MSKVEEVARAITTDQMRSTLAAAGLEYEPGQDALLKMYARTAIEAQAKPSRAMIDAGVAFALNVSVHGEGGWSKYVEALYEHMTRAALSEEGE